MRRGIGRLRAGGSGFNPLSLFAAGEQGAWYSPDDFSTQFQDSAGTTPVTAVGQPVGKVLDKSGRGNHLIQATTANRPTLQQDGGGRYYWSTDGIDDSWSALDVAGLRGATMSFVIGIDPLTLGSREDWISNGDAALFSTNNYIVGNNATSLTFFPRTPASVLTLSPLTASTRIVATITADGINVNPRVNGVAGSAVAGTLGTDSTTGLLIGKSNAGNYAAVSFYGIIIRAGVLTAAQIASSEAWMNKKAGAF